MIAHKNYEGRDGFVDIPIRTVQGLGPRHCTSRYKIAPIHQKCREILGKQRIRKERVAFELGISTDEVFRIKDAKNNWAVNLYPLIEKRLNRTQCETWLKQNHPEMTFGKSACAGCPYRTQQNWVFIYENYPEIFEETCQIDDKLRNIRPEYQSFLQPPYYTLARSYPVGSEGSRNQADAAVLIY